MTTAIKEVKMNVFEEILRLKNEGYTPELLFNYRTSNYEIKFVKPSEMTTKWIRIPKDFLAKEDLLEAVYGKNKKKFSL